MAKKIAVIGTEIRILTIEQEDYISLTDMLKAKDGDFFISDWLSDPMVPSSNLKPPRMLDAQIWGQRTFATG